MCIVIHMPWRNYSIDLEEIRAIDKEPAHTYWHVLDHIAFMGWPTREASLRKALEKAPEGVRLFWLTRTIEGAVEDGGLGQYFGHRRPTWLHGMAKQAILQFGCPQVVEILEEVERYVHRNRSRLRDGMPPDEWAAIMGPVALKKALRDVNGRFMRACTRLQDAREKYLQEHPEKFTPRWSQRPLPLEFWIER